MLDVHKTLSTYRFRPHDQQFDWTNQDSKFKLRAMYNRDKNTIKKDGVNNFQYKIVSTSLYKNKMKRIKVDV